MKQCGAGVCMLTAFVPHKQVVFIYTPFAEQKGLGDSCRIFWAVYKTILQYRVYIRTELARNAKNVAGVLRCNVECIASTVSAVRCFVTVRLQRQVKYSSSSMNYVTYLSREEGPPTLILEKKRSEKGVGLYVSSRKRSDNALVFL